MMRFKLPFRAALVLLLSFAAACGDKDDTTPDDSEAVDDSEGTDDSEPNDDSEDPDDSAAPDEDGDGYVTTQDCDDTDADVNPGQTEVTYDGKDNDCNPNTLDDDLDGDGFKAADDCDDGDNTVNPSATEICDGIDNNCDDDTDGADAADAKTWFLDKDGDSYGDSAVAQTACDEPTGYTAQEGDCDDDDADFNPGASEDSCTDPNDYNCDGSVGAVDGDGDGFYACEECDDTDKSVNPKATEVCDSVDNNCDGDIDEKVTTTYYLDSDADGYGLSSSTLAACSLPKGYSATSGDCNDSSSSISPGASEVCDKSDTDEDCDSLADDKDSSTASSGKTTFYADADSDGYGSSKSSASYCDQPSGYVSDNTDCDDTSSSISPAATEVSGNSKDDDCDGTVDETTYTYSYSSDIQTIWTSKCSGCHTGGGSSGTLKLDSGSSYANIVNVASSQLSSMDRIEPSSTSKSYLYHKLKGTHSSVGGSGSTMPKSGSITSAEVSKIETWINEGAPNN